MRKHAKTKILSLWHKKTLGQTMYIWNPMAASLQAASENLPKSLVKELLF